MSATRCAEVLFRGTEAEAPRWRDEIGDELWNPKGGEGHVIVAIRVCGEPLGTGPHPDWPATCGGCGTCLGMGLKPGGLTAVCECGEDSGVRDHHYWRLP